MALLKFALLCAVCVALPSGSGWAASAQTELLVWKISAESSPEAAVYVYASSPTPRKKILRLDPSIEEVYEKADLVVLPTNSVDLPTGDKLRLIADYCGLPKGQTLESKLPAETSTRLKQTALELDMEFAGFDRLVPWFAGHAVELKKLERAGFFGPSELEYYFLSRARADGKESIVLEPASALFRRRSARPNEVQVRQLDRRLYADAAHVPALYEAWDRNDLAALEAASLAPLRAHPELAPAFAVVSEESKLIATGLEKLVKRGGVIFAVIPAENIAGEGGAVALLKTRGYTVERLASSGANSEG